MKHNQQDFNTIYLKDYQPPAYQIDTVDLTFELHETQTTVTSIMQIKRHTDVLRSAVLALDGEHLELVFIRLDEKVLDPNNNDYEISNEQLMLQNLPDSFVLTIKTIINPIKNTELSGLYLAKGVFCTQCEAHGFRRMTYFLDRPDNLSTFTTTIIADKILYPFLLSNGNLIETTELDNNRLTATWHDPFKKPSYLFALVAGDFDCLEDSFTTKSARSIALKLYVEKGNIDKATHAMDSLKKAMKWDEDVYGREYDLDIFMIVAVSAFNMGAMENKGLNIFNDKYILAKPETATDQDYEAIESVVAHEYFHNWTGNRVTCRDWFQLSLKEGLTVFRDQEFSRDMNSRDVNRIQDVEILRAHQFPEDDSPLAHPVRPAAYVEINNFYTSTVYNKGAEVIRMLHTFLGTDGFRKGMDLYFERHDGQAVTTDDFVSAMADANQVDFSQFKHWYTQAGTPVLHITDEYNPATKTLTLSVKQSCPDTVGQKDKKPFHIPLAIGLLDSQGQEIDFMIADNSLSATTQILSICDKEQQFSFDSIAEKPVISFLRNFSAPVKIQYDYREEDLVFLLAHDRNGFSRWEAGQTLAIQSILKLIDDVQQDKSLGLKSTLTDAYQYMLQDQTIDNALKAKILTLPTFNYIAEQLDVIDVSAIYQVKKFIKQQIAEDLHDDFLTLFNQLQNFTSYSNQSSEIAKRALKNVCLDYLMTTQKDDVRSLCYQQFQQANNMTDVISALSYLSHEDSNERSQALASFYDKWQDDDLVIDKWFSIQARADLPDTLAQVKALMQHNAFDIKNPNRIRALIGAFVAGNPIHFHAEDGKSYDFLTEQVLKVDIFNPQVSARLVLTLTRFRKYDDTRRTLMRMQLENILKDHSLSKDVYEIVSKSLKDEA